LLFIGKINTRTLFKIGKCTGKKSDVRSSCGFDAIATLPGIFAAVNKPDVPPDETE